MELKKDGLLEIIAEHRTGDDLDETVRKDKGYQDALVQQEEILDKLDVLGFTA